MTPRLHFVLGLFACLSSRAFAAQDSTAARVLAAEDRRFAAMIRADTAALGTMLAADVVYTHSTGEKQDKAAFLRSLGSGELRYKRVAPTERLVRVLGPAAAVVVGRSNMEVEAQGRPRSFTIRYLAVYARTGKDWQLVAWQSTLLPD